MKIFSYLLLTIFTFVYAIGLAIDVAMFIAGGLGGPYAHMWVIPAHLIFGSWFFFAYIMSLKPGAAYSAFKAQALPILLVIVLPLPILFAYQNQYQSEKAHSDYEQTCRTVELESYKYKFCPGHPGTFGPGVSVIGSNPGDAEYARAMKVWDQEGWSQFKSETDWYYQK